MKDLANKADARHSSLIYIAQNPSLHSVALRMTQKYEHGKSVYHGMAWPPSYN
jgi:hypothetical protein